MSRKYIYIYIEKKNKGFTLIELIVAIVILAILIGVTISGVSTYVNKARLHTDIQNANTISTLLQEARMKGALNNTYNLFGGNVESLKLEWTESTGSLTSYINDSDFLHNKKDLVVWNELGYNSINYENLFTELSILFPDGLPACKSGNVMRIVFLFSVNGDLDDVFCGIYSTAGYPTHVTPSRPMRSNSGWEHDLKFKDRILE